MQQALKDLLTSNNIEDIKLGLIIARKENVPFAELDEIYANKEIIYNRPTAYLDAIRANPDGWVRNNRLYTEKCKIWEYYLMFHDKKILEKSTINGKITKYFRGWHNYK